MKVTCDLCGSKFEFNPNNSCCPSCGFHYHIDGEAQRSFDGFSANHNTHTISNSSSSNNGFVKEQMRQEKVKPLKIGKIIFVLIIIGIILLAIIISKGTNIYEYSKESETPFANNSQFIAKIPTNHSIWETIYLNCGTLRINEVKIESSDTWSVMEGYSLVSVKYSYEHNDDYDDYAFECIELLLTTKSGNYIKPAPTYAIEEDSNLDNVTWEEDGYTLCEDVFLNNGIMFYVVKTDDLSGLYITETDGDGNFIDAYNIIDLEDFVIIE